MTYFDADKVAGEAHIPADKLRELRELMAREFPRDEMMASLHVLRACMAVRDGHVTLDEVLAAPVSTTGW